MLLLSDDEISRLLSMGEAMDAVGRKPSGSSPRAP